TSVPARDTLTVICSGPCCVITQGPPASSQSGESAVHAVSPSPSQTPSSGTSPSTTVARLPLRSQPLAAQSTPSVSGFWFIAVTARPSEPRRPLPVPATVFAPNTASCPLTVVKPVLPSALRSLNIGSEAKRTEKVIGSI